MGSPVWMLDLKAGQTWRFATRAVDFNGNHYMDGLEDPGSFSKALSFSEPTEESFSFTINAHDVSELDAEDVSRGASGTIYYWLDPDSDEDPVIVVSGIIDDPEYGGEDEPFTASVVEVPWNDNGLIPTELASINDGTWPNRDPEAGIEDEFYPIVIGEPGDDSLTVPAMGSPAFYVQTGATDYALVTGHAVLASTIQVYNLTTPATGPENVVIVDDGLGFEVSAADISTWPPPLGEELWVIWNGGGGLENPERPGTLLTACGDVIEWMLHKSTLRVDWGRMRAAKMALNAYRLDGFILAAPDERVKPWSWINDNLLGILPVSVRTSPNGLYLVVFDPSRPVTEAVQRMEDGRNCERISPVKVEGVDDVANDISFNYAIRANNDKPTKTARVTGSQFILDNFPGSIPSSMCKDSIKRFGVITEEISATMIWDAATATRLAFAMATRKALPQKLVTYEVDDELAGLEPGDIVKLTDATLGWEDKTAYVWEVNVSDVREITLRLWSLPARDINQNH